MATSTIIKKKLELLRKQIRFHSNLYYVLDEPEISDIEYDSIFSELIAIEKDFPEFITSDSPSQKVGAEPVDYFPSVAHKNPMLSLDNVFNDDDLFLFNSRTQERLKIDSDIWYSADILMASVIGGSAMLMGPLIGGAFVVMVPFFLETMADFSYILKGVALIVVLWIAPRGVAELIGRPWIRARKRRLSAARRGNR